MRVTQFDAHNNKSITVEIEGPDYNQVIKGEGYFIIVEPGSPQVSFSKARKNICFGDVTQDIIPDYTNQQYADEYGDRLTGSGMTVREYMQQNCRMDVKEKVA